MRRQRALYCWKADVQSVSAQLMAQQQFRGYARYTMSCTIKHCYPLNHAHSMFHAHQVWYHAQNKPLNPADARCTRSSHLSCRPAPQGAATTVLTSLTASLPISNGQADTTIVQTPLFAGSSAVSLAYADQHKQSQSVINNPDCGPRGAACPTKKCCSYCSLKSVTTPQHVVLYKALPIMFMPSLP
jgi:hypothetical protein